MKIRLPRFLREDSRRSPHLRTSERYRAAYDKTGSRKPKRKVYSLGENTWLSRCKHYDELWEAYPLFRQAVTSLAGLVNPQGVFFKPAEKKPQKKSVMTATEMQAYIRETETYALAEEAQYRCEKFKETHFLNGKIYNTVWNIAKYGSCFWELTDSPIFDFRVPPLQECIEPAEADDQGNITVWRQVVNGVVTAEWNSPRLILLSWNATTATWPYGNGLAVGLETEMDMLVSVEESVKDYSEKAAWPYEILALGNGAGATVNDSDYQDAKSEWRNRQAGDGIATRNMPVEIIAGGTNSAPIRELASLCELMKDNIHDGFIVPPLSKLYNSTEASAKVLVQHVMTVLGQPLQWLLAESLQSYVLKPMLEQAGFSRKSCPVPLFESPDTAKKEEGEFWVSLVTAKMQSPKQACEHLNLEYDEDYWKQEEKKQQEQFEQKNAQFGAQKQDGEEGGVTQQQKSEEVWEVRRKEVK